MAVAVSNVRKMVWGDRVAVACTLTFSGNYATGGEALVYTQIPHLSSKIDDVLFDGIAVSADLATATPVKFNSATGKIASYEGSAAGTALSEKTNAEVYATGLNVRAIVIGY